MTLIVQMLIGEANQTCVYWPRSGTDRYGNPTSGTAVELACRWETKVSNAISHDGVQYTQSATVYLKDSVTVDGRLYLGTLANAPATPPQEGRIRNVDTVPAIENDETLYIASV